jgi:hypothetical protein
LINRANGRIAVTRSDIPRSLLSRATSPHAKPVLHPRLGAIHLRVPGFGSETVACMVVHRRAADNPRYCSSPPPSSDSVQHFPDLGSDGGQPILAEGGAPKGFDLAAMDASSSEQSRLRCPSQISVCSEISRASSTSIPRYLTVDSSLEWPSKSCTARRFLVRR